VVTVEQEWVRLECFSGDAGVYARVDLRPDCFHEGEIGSPGTTNVDFGAEFAARLSALRPGKRSAFEVGEESVTLHTDQGKAIERQVELPERWLRGFLQVQAIARAAQPLFELNQVQSRAFLSAVPAKGSAGEPMLVTPVGGITAPQSRLQTHALEVNGLHRLKLLRRLAPQIKRLDVWAVGDRAPSFWVAHLDAARFTLGVSSALNFAFSGDGKALLSSRRPLDDELVERARSTLRDERRFQASDLSRKLNIPEGTAGELVDLLSEQGLIGYDLTDGVFYPRHLPYVEQSEFVTQPRDVNARRVVDSGRVEVSEITPIDDRTEFVGWVQGDHATYRVRVLVDSSGTIADGDCTCLWVIQYGMQRGPCKHILALRLAGAPRE
jgi:SWIM zinc finger